MEKGIRTPVESHYATGNGLCDAFLVARDSQKHHHG